MSNLAKESEISNKQLTLEDVFANSYQRKQNDAMEVIRCPLCHEEVTFIEMDAHMDTCVLKAEYDSFERDELAFNFSMNEKDGEDPLIHVDSVDNVKIDFPCPICNKLLGRLSQDNEAFNRHIDECLNKKTVQKIITESTPCSTPTKFQHNYNKRTLPLSHSPSGSKRKKSSVNKYKTIDSFFKV